MTDLVRICPVCGKQNPSDETFCACGAYLADVDFTHVGVAAPVVAAPVVQAAQLICPHEDCAQPNPAGSALCVYCNRPLAMPVVVQEDELQSALPPTLRAQFRVLERLPTEGGQADLVLVETPQHEQRVVKLYRRGIQPDWQVLERLPQVNSPHLVQIFQHGIAEQIAYEVMAYCAAGSARRLLENWPLTNDTLRRLIEQLATTLMALHAQHILHRDLKPENILLRQSHPLDIALIDFGASSLQMATQYFTKGARTAHYAAPEVLTGVLDEKSDWWAVGMMVLEAITGRHPYEGLSEQVALHQLATQSVDVHGVMDDRLRMLCRGLLLRNPSKRWGGEELTRWLVGDDTLTMPDDAGDGTAVRPYTLRKAQCRTRSDLALALAQYWEDGIKDLRRGTITQWVEQELRDFNLARDIHDVMAMHELTDDGRLLRVLLRALPGMPPIWRGKVITQQVLVQVAARVIDHPDEKATSNWLLSIYLEDVLGVLGEYGNADMARIGVAWKQSAESYRQWWARSRALEAEYIERPFATNTSAVVDVQYLMYLAPMRLNVPPISQILPDLVLALYLPDFSSSLKKIVNTSCLSTVQYCDWYQKFIQESPENDPLFWCVAHRLLPFAVEDSGQENKRREQTVRNADMDVQSVTDKIRVSSEKLFEIILLRRLMLEDVERLQREINTWVELVAWVKGLDHENMTLHKMTQQLTPITIQAMTLQSFLDKYQHLLAINDIWLKPTRIAFAAMVILGGFTWGWVLPILLFILLGLLVSWRIDLVKKAQNEGFMRLRQLIKAMQGFITRNWQDD